MLYAPDSYGGFLTAPQAVRRAQAIRPDLRGHPMADGGEGTLDALRWHRPDLTVTQHTVTGPLGEPAAATLAIGPTHGFLETAQAIGLPLVGDRRDPLRATSHGVGELIRHTQDRGRRAQIGLGGSATVDGGFGAAQALGLVSGDLHAPGEIMGPAIWLDGVEVWCDVRTPLEDACRRYGPQKGLTAAQIAPQTAALMRWAARLNRWRGAQGRAAISPALEGGGAAGGLGFFLAALGATLRPGAEAFAAETRLDDAIAGEDVVIVGEGRMDETSFEGKVMEAVVRRARAAGCTVVALVGVAHIQSPLDTVIEIGGMRMAAFDDAVRQLPAPQEDRR